MGGEAHSTHGLSEIHFAGAYQQCILEGQIQLTATIEYYSCDTSGTKQTSIKQQEPILQGPQERLLVLFPIDLLILSVDCQRVRVKYEVR